MGIEEQDYEKLRSLIEEMKNISHNLSDYISNNIYVMGSVEGRSYYFKSRIRTFTILEESMAKLQDRISKVKSVLRIIN